MAQGERHANHHRLEVMSEFMSGEVARSLQLLSAIDGTVEALVYTCRSMEALSETCESLIFRAETENLDGEPLEVDVLPWLEKAQRSSITARSVMAIKLHNTLAAPELDGDDCVVEAYSRSLVPSTD